MKCSVLVYGAQRPQQIVPFGGAVKWGGASRLWFGQGTTFDSTHLAVWLAGLGMDVPIGLGVSLTPLRSPHHAAIEARSVAAISGCSVVAGFGPGSQELQVGVLGERYESPIEALREYICSVRVLLGTTEQLLGSTWSYFPAPLGPLPPMPTPPIEIGLGVLRTEMAALVGEVADCGISWLLPSAFLGEAVVPRMVAASVDRPKKPRMVAIVPVALDEPGRDLTTIASATFGAHLAEPHYRAAVRAAGIPIIGELEHDVSVAVEHGLLCHGDVTQVVEGLRAYAMAGVDEVVLNASGVGQTYGANAAAHDVRQILECAQQQELHHV